MRGRAQEKREEDENGSDYDCANYDEDDYVAESVALFWHGI